MMSRQDCVQEKIKQIGEILFAFFAYIGYYKKWV